MASLGAGTTAAGVAGRVVMIAVVWDWYATLYSGIMDAGITPPPAAGLYAYVGVAAFEAVVEGAPGHRSLAGQLNGSRPVGKAGDPNAVDGPIARAGPAGR